MNREWAKIYIASLFEVCWVTGLKHADNLWGWLGTIISITISFYGFISAGRALPMGTVYAVFVGLGTAGTVITEMLFFSEPVNLEKLFFIFLLLIGVIGLKFVNDGNREEKEVNS